MRPQLQRRPHLLSRRLGVTILCGVVSGSLPQSHIRLVLPLQNVDIPPQGLAIVQELLLPLLGDLQFPGELAVHLPIVVQLGGQSLLGLGG